MRRIFGRMLAACAQLRRPNEPVSVFNVRNEPTLYQFWMSVDTLNLLAQGRGAEALAEVLREPEEWMRPWALAIIHHAEGHRAESDAALQALIAGTRMGRPIRLPRCMPRAASWNSLSSGSSMRMTSAIPEWGK
jgi:hypothetical protein